MNNLEWRRMQIVDARWTPTVNILRIRCDCRTLFSHPANLWQVRCPLGHKANLAELRHDWHEDGMDRRRLDGLVME